MKASQKAFLDSCDMRSMSPYYRRPFYAYALKRRSLNALVSTETELSDIAAAARIGLRSSPPKA